MNEGFPGVLVVTNLRTSAEDTASIPGPGRSHLPQSNEARGQPEPAAWSPRSATGEAAATRRPRTAPKSSPRWLHLEESPHGSEDPAPADIDQHTVKNVKDREGIRPRELLLAWKEDRRPNLFGPVQNENMGSFLCK